MDLPITSAALCGALPSSAQTRQLARLQQAPASGYSHANAQHRQLRRRELVHHHVRPPPRPSCVVRASVAKGLVTSEALTFGDLVLFQKDRERSTLGLIQQQDGKRNLWVLEAQAQGVRKTSITPRQVLYKLPGGPFNEGDLLQFTQAAQIDTLANPQEGISSPLADAWEMAVADNITQLSLQELAGLVMEDESALNLFKCYRMLNADRLYFKQVPTKGIADEPSYQPRTPAAVEAARLQLAAEAAAREDESSWSKAVRDALGRKKRAEQPTPEQWETGRHARRIAALKALAIQDVSGVSTDVLKLAQQSLALAGIIPPAAAASPQGADLASGSPIAEAATNLLVDVRAWRRHEPVAALRKGVPMGFPTDLETEAQALLQAPPPDSCAAIRVDLTHLPSYTIDDSGTTEIDDALSVEYLTDDNSVVDGELQPALPAVRLWAHVSDPTRWLAPGGRLMDAAKERSRTLYFPWGAVFMFPKALAEGPFSLRCDQSSDAMSFGMVLRSDGSIGDVQVVPSRIRVTRQLTYDQADQLAAGNVDAVPVEGDLEAVARDLKVLRMAADVRRSYREACGAIEIPLPETKVRVPWSQLDAGRPQVTLQRLSQWESPARGLVAEMMILAGEAAGSMGAAASLPLPYRGQPAPYLPAASDLEGLQGVCKGYKLRRCMTRSGVSAVPQRHSSLGLDAYVQVTSPIRRWADIVAHSQLKAHLLGQALPFSAADVDAINMVNSSDLIRELGAAERMEEAYWITEYFRQRQASKVAQQWSATVLGWQRQDLKLCSVLLDELGYETVVKVDYDVMPGDYVQLALLEARPVAGVLRFYVTDYLSSQAQPEEGDYSDVWPSVYDSASDDILSLGSEETASEEGASSAVLLEQVDVEEMMMMRGVDTVEVARSTADETVTSAQKLVQA